MAITSYITLLAAVESWSHRDELDDYIPDFLKLTEARLNDMLLLKDYESDESLTLTTDVNYVAIPTGFISPIALWLIVDSQRVPLPRVLPEQLPYDTDSGQPREWAIDGANIRFDCPADSGYSAKFRMLKSDNLSITNTSNYLLERRPDIYLAGCLVELARFTQDVELFNIWEPKFLKATKELMAAENRSRRVTLRNDYPSGRGRSNILTGDA